MGMFSLNINVSVGDSLLSCKKKVALSDLAAFFLSDEEDLLIERSTRTGMLNPGDPWQTIIHDGPVAHIVYRVRVRCDEHYYSSKCNKLCVPRDDYFGHYRCEASGAQVCLDGWMGPDCRTGKLTKPLDSLATVLDLRRFGVRMPFPKKVNQNLQQQQHPLQFEHEVYVGLLLYYMHSGSW